MAERNSQNPRCLGTEGPNPRCLHGVTRGMTARTASLDRPRASLTALDALRAELDARALGAATERPAALVVRISGPRAEVAKAIAAAAETGVSLEAGAWPW